MYTEMSINWHTYPQKYANHKFEHFLFLLRESVQVAAWNSRIGWSFTVHQLIIFAILKILRPKYGTNKLHSCKSNQIVFTKTDQQNGPFPHRTSYTGTLHTKELATFAQLAPLYYCYYYFIIIIILQLNYMDACQQWQTFLHLKMASKLSGKLYQKFLWFTIHNIPAGQQQVRGSYTTGSKARVTQKKKNIHTYGNT
jgi:hypothetical protein